MRLASFLRLPLATTQDDVDSEEFVLWRAQFAMEDDKKLKEIKKWEYYQAQQTWYIYMTIPSDKKKRRTMDDFLFKHEEPKPKSSEQKRIDLINTKMGWMGIVGMAIEELIDGSSKKDV